MKVLPEQEKFSVRDASFVWAIEMPYFLVGYTEESRFKSHTKEVTQRVNQKTLGNPLKANAVWKRVQKKGNDENRVAQNTKGEEVKRTADAQNFMAEGRVWC